MVQDGGTQDQRRGRRGDSLAQCRSVERQRQKGRKPRGRHTGNNRMFSNQKQMDRPERPEQTKNGVGNYKDFIKMKEELLITIAQEVEDYEDLLRIQSETGADLKDLETMYYSII